MSNLQVAETIRQQLGGARFSAMTGARDFVGSDDHLQFRLPARLAQRGITSVVIRLDATDTYTATFYAIRGLNVREVEQRSGVYADDLQRVFKDATGLDTHL